MSGHMKMRYETVENALEHVREARRLLIESGGQLEHAASMIHVNGVNAERIISVREAIRALVTDLGRETKRIEPTP